MWEPDAESGSFSWSAENEIYIDSARRQLLTLSGAEGEILNNAERYLRIIFAGSLFVNFAQMWLSLYKKMQSIPKKVLFIPKGLLSSVYLIYFS